MRRGSVSGLASIKASPHWDSISIVTVGPTVLTADKQAAYPLVQPRLSVTGYLISSPRQLRSLYIGLTSFEMQHSVRMVTLSSFGDINATTAADVSAPETATVSRWNSAITAAVKSHVVAPPGWPPAATLPLPYIWFWEVYLMILPGSRPTWLA